MLAVIPLALLAVLLFVLMRTGPLGLVQPEGAPPVERLIVERAVLTPDGIRLSVLNDGPDPVTIAQVTVDDAYWAFTAEENRTELGHLGRTRLDIPYPWVQGEAHFVKVITSTGTVFEHEIAVAVETPKVETRQILAFALIGLYVGVIPVALGLMWFPLVKRLGPTGLDVLLALTHRAAAVPADRHRARGCVLGVGAAGVVSGPGRIRCRGARRVSRARSVRLVAQGASLGRRAAWTRTARCWRCSSRPASACTISARGSPSARRSRSGKPRSALCSWSASCSTTPPKAWRSSHPWRRSARRCGSSRGWALSAARRPSSARGSVGWCIRPVLAVLFLGLGAGAIAQVLLQIGRQMADTESISRRFSSPPVLSGLAAGFLIMLVTGMLVG